MVTRSLSWKSIIEANGREKQNPERVFHSGLHVSLSRYMAIIGRSALKL